MSLRDPWCRWCGFVLPMALGRISWYYIPDAPKVKEPSTMSSPAKLLAIDLGAESGRGVLGLFDGRQLRLEVVHRFANHPVRTLEALHWDVLSLYREIEQ